MKTIVRESLNEELLGSIWSYDDEIEIYKNPPRIKRMGPWCRAITDQDGNFYVATMPNATNFEVVVTHLGLIEWLQDTKHLNVKTTWDGRMYIKGIAWQRYKNTNQFYLGESYTDTANFIMYVKEFMKNVNIFKPDDIEFVLQNITDKDEPII